MANYSILNMTELRRIAERYNLTVTSYEPITSGQGNSNYLLQTPRDKFILTIFEIPPHRAETICSIYTLLATHNFPTSRIQYVPNGSALTSFKGKAVLLKPFIEGAIQESLNTAQLKQVGYAMSQLHQIPAPADLNKTHYYERKTLPAVFQSRFTSAYIDCLAERNDAINQNIPGGLPRTLVHGDVFRDNVIFDDQKFAAIIDFEDACQHYRAFDLGMAIVGTCTENECVDLKKGRALLAGYEDHSPLLPDEKACIPLFTEYGALLTSAWRFWKFNIDSPTQEKSDTYLEMYMIAKHAFEIPEDSFLTNNK